MHLGQAAVRIWKCSDNNNSEQQKLLSVLLRNSYSYDTTTLWDRYYYYLHFAIRKPKDPEVSYRKGTEPEITTVGVTAPDVILYKCVPLLTRSWFPHVQSKESGQKGFLCLFHPSDSLSSCRGTCGGEMLKRQEYCWIHTCTVVVSPRTGLGGKERREWQRMAFAFLPHTVPLTHS